MLIRLVVSFVFLCTIISCQGTLNFTDKWMYDYTETFNEVDRPELEYNSVDDYFLVKPWNYNKKYNASREYPLLIYLHGGGQTKYLKNLYYMGMGYYDWSVTKSNMTSEYQQNIADDFRQTYPCFTFVPQEETLSWDTSELIALIEELKSAYRIDTDRIYIHGFSMGGTILYPLAEAYYEQYGQLFAGIIRLNGGYDSLSDDIVQKSSVWVMCGENGGYISEIRNAYNYLKSHSYNSGAIESEEMEYSIATSIDSYVTNTWTLINDGVIVARKSEFPGEGHFITTFPFGDPSIDNHDVMDWLFDQSLSFR